MALAFHNHPFLIFLASFVFSCSVFLVESYEIASSPRVPALFVFGDSTVDPGNNDYIVTTFRGNYAPYGRDFIDHQPTGRFSNGKLATDFVAAAMGLKETLPAYLDPALTIRDLVTGVSFASAGSGYDNLTSEVASALPLWKQVQYFKSYRTRLADIVGDKNASNIIKNALFICSIGTNDFTVTYFGLPIRRRQITVEQYQDSLLQVANAFIQDLYREGARKLAFLGLLPLGCLPIERTLKLSTPQTLEEQNQVALSFNEKLKGVLASVKPRLPDLKAVYVDVYDVFSDIVHNPGKYGFEISDKGCCGTGLIEFGPLCNKKTPFTCSDASKYVFWDAIHPTEKTYQIVANIVLYRDIPLLL